MPSLLPKPLRKSITSAIHIEEYGLAVVLFLFFIFLPLLAGDRLLQGGLLETVRYYVLRNANFFWLFFLALFFFFLLHFYVHVAFLINEMVNRRIKIRPAFMVLVSEGMRLSLAIARVTLFLLLSFGLLSIGLQFLEYAVEGRIDNLRVMEFDRTVFRTYPFFWFHQAGSWQKNLFDPVAPLVRASFDGLATVMGIVGIALVVGNRHDLFRKYLIAIILVVVLGFPLWLLFPAFSPHDAFLRFPEEEIRQPLADLLYSFNPVAVVSQYLKDVTAMKGSTQPVSTVASMHVAWSVLSALFAFRLWKPTAVFFVPWALLSVFGTTYLGQHYAVDMLFTIPIIGAGVWLAEFLARFEPRLYTFSGTRWEMATVLREDAALFLRHFPLLVWWRERSMPSRTSDGAYPPVMPRWRNR